MSLLSPCSTKHPTQHWVGLRDGSKPLVVANLPDWARGIRVVGTPPNSMVLELPVGLKFQEHLHGQPLTLRSGDGQSCVCPELIAVFGQVRPDQPRAVDRGRWTIARRGADTILLTSSSSPAMIRLAFPELQLVRASRLNSPEVQAVWIPKKVRAEVSLILSLTDESRQLRLTANVGGAQHVTDFYKPSLLREEMQAWASFVQSL